MVLVVVLLVVLVLGDVLARTSAEAELARRVRQRVPSASTSVHIRSFPFLGRLAASGTVGDVQVRATSVGVRALRIASITVDVHDVRIDRHELFSRRRVVLDGAGRGTAVAVIDFGSLGRALSVPLRLAGGRLGVDVGGRTLATDVVVRQNAIELRPPIGPVLRLPVTIPLLPCDPTVSVSGTTLRLTCQVSRVPAELVGAAERLRSG